MSSDIACVCTVCVCCECVLCCVCVCAQCGGIEIDTLNKRLKIDHGERWIHLNDRDIPMLLAHSSHMST